MYISSVAASSFLCRHSFIIITRSPDILQAPYALFALHHLHDYSSLGTAAVVSRTITNADRSGQADAMRLVRVFRDLESSESGLLDSSWNLDLCMSEHLNI